MYKGGKQKIRAVGVVIWEGTNKTTWKVFDSLPQVRKKGGDSMDIRRREGENKKKVSHIGGRRRVGTDFRSVCPTTAAENTPDSWTAWFWPPLLLPNRRESYALHVIHLFRENREQLR